jgi:hypothetical protein
MSKPASCQEARGENNVRGSIGYEASDGSCHYMGQLQTGKWSLLNERRAIAIAIAAYTPLTIRRAMLSRSPRDGLKLTYTGGSECAPSAANAPPRRRSTEFFLECSPAAGRGAPTGVFGDCNYVVTWETSLACPIRPAPVLSLLFWALVAALVYLAAGFLYNVRRAGGLAAAGGWDALPHAAALRAAGRQVLAAAAAARAAALAAALAARGASGAAAERGHGGYRAL